MENDSQHFFLVWMCGNSTITLILVLLFYSIFCKIILPLQQIIKSF